MQHGTQTVHGIRGDRRSIGARLGGRGLLIAAVLLVFVLLPSAAFAAGPHGDYASSLPAGTSKCSQCHRPHVAATTRGLFSIEPTTGVLAQTALCMKCHGYVGPATNAAVSFETALPSGHRIEDATGTVAADLTNTCSGCHDAHTKAAGLPRAEINGRDVSRTVDANSWCLACHDPDLPKNWSGLSGAAYYDTLLAPASKDASGYPLLGTFRGTAAYQATSAHASIPASATAGRGEGDCLWCHASHRAPSTYDSLLGEFGPSAPGDAGADVCFRCHDQADGYGSGHFVTNVASVLPAGSPLPCYECHNVHGSRNGNTMLISDALGSGLNPDSESATFTPEAQSHFCFSCHLTADDYWWDSEDATMQPLSELATAPATVVKAVAGIPREQMVPLSAGVAEHLSTGLAGCSCHGSIHNPGSFAGLHLSTTNGTCVTCHDADLVTEHVDNNALTCATCHESVDPLVVGAIAAGDLTCTTCHGSVAHFDAHWSTTTGACYDCHASNLVTEHVDNQALTCGTCHDSTDADVLAAIAAQDTSCLAYCHDFASHPYDAGLHTATVSASTIAGTITNTSGVPYTRNDGSTSTYSGQTCGQCHLMDLMAEHSKPSSNVSAQACAACHPSPRDSFVSWTGTCQQADCHPTIHADMALRHAYTYPSSPNFASCGSTRSTCHQGQWQPDLAAVHEEAQHYGTAFIDTSGYPDGCLFCHTATTVPPIPGACTDCHPSGHGTPAPLP